ncbi:4-hydroxy-3-methylbut-2-enyl diphosphate reductase [Leptospira sp. GIMC2001]|uniref:4-hydroxy-3-methylbut-2-enyl diphosphate reductase n=1 Tax=Leptospira sp. GIMC2001 TaxID=1513297 RepID=UPI00234BB05B|nr:4-hydroxy-3-methylbut-2-enyl diphosphate reductase [Leptospira sp. GIMC2001]WCL51343.1 4-hydroxy-3-methylbut-2-enyl diphosphate reductase [Leptospira sp. GIMC2001]
MLKKVYLANPRGFCAGVKYAISYVDKVHEESQQPVYVRKEIVHNRRVVEDMKKRGIQFIEDLSEAPEGSTVIFSAHGVSPAVVEEAKKRNMKVGDATCPLVTRVHRKAKNLKDTHQFIYIGHHGHDEAIGTMGEAPMFLVESPEEVQDLKDKIDPSKPLTYLMQTTLSVSDTKKIVDKIAEVFPFVEHPAKDDICYATTERQEAVTQMIDAVDAMIVIGANNSSNSLRLLQLAQKTKPLSFRISSAEELDIHKMILENNIETIGITAGASSPQILVDEICNKLSAEFTGLDISLFPESREDTMNFKLPKILIQE